MQMPSGLHKPPRAADPSGGHSGFSTRVMRASATSPRQADLNANAVAASSSYHI